MSYYIGLMIGSSADNIDAAIIEVNSTDTKLVKGAGTAIPTNIKQQLFALAVDSQISIFDLNQLEYNISQLLIKAAKKIMQLTNLSNKEIKAVGVHGFTYLHQPNNIFSSMQLVNPNLLAQELKIDLVTDFRRMDIANGGQGAPLAPAFHYRLWGNMSKVAIVNIGGMANVSAWNEAELIGFDTGPGNVLLDSWVRFKLNKNYDCAGNLASQGEVIVSLFNQLKTIEFFSKTPPKSTSRDQFNLQFILDNIENVDQYKACDVQATLAELTAWSIVNAIIKYCSWVDDIYICGGGIYNLDLIRRMKNLTNKNINSIEKLDWSPDWLEAAAFAWLAKQRVDRQITTVATVTGAATNSILGGLYAC